MIKIYEVKSCWNCPHSLSNEYAYYCAHSDVCFKNSGSVVIWNNDKQRVNSTGFPQWCPLEDK